jgi:hypothetical protein
LFARSALTESSSTQNIRRDNVKFSFARSAKCPARCALTESFDSKIQERKPEALFEKKCIRPHKVCVGGSILKFYLRRRN